MFLDMLRTQVLLKNIVTTEDWEKMSEHIQFDFLYDNHFAELKEAELFENRINLANISEPYIGKYFSQDYIRRKVIRQTDADILEQDAKIKQEIEDGIIVDPLEASMTMDGIAGLGGQQPTVTSNGDLGKPVMEPDLESQGNSTEVKMPKGGEI
jgi:hypothetical protein